MSEETKENKPQEFSGEVAAKVTEEKKTEDAQLQKVTEEKSVEVKTDVKDSSEDKKEEKPKTEEKKEKKPKAKKKEEVKKEADAEKGETTISIAP